MVKELTRKGKPEEGPCSQHCLQKNFQVIPKITMRFQKYGSQKNETLTARAGLIGQQ